MSLPSSVKILVIGAGPTGLGAAIRLHELGEKDWVLLEASEGSGGLSKTSTTPEGFLFDMGGHVIFSHYDYFDDVLNYSVGSDKKNWNTHQRVSYIWFKDRFVPYPFQNNLYCLDTDDKLLCIDGLIDAITKPNSVPPRTFDEWICNSMGMGIANLFMRPYNFKVWAYPPSILQCEWLGERVATVDTKRVIRNVIMNQPDEGWGPNAVFRFPKSGGTGGIWRKVAANLPRERMYFNRSVVKIDLHKQIVFLSDGYQICYENLITTVPLDTTLRFVGQPDLASRLRYSSTHVIGLGLRGPNPHDKKCWLYFPEDSTPFYRATVFSLYAESNCPPASQFLPNIRLAGSPPNTCPEDATPRAGPYWSLMFEVSESVEFKPVDANTIVEETIRGAIKAKLISNETEIVSIFHHRLEHGYPTPHVDRDSVLREAFALLKSHKIWSRGRFGAWKYEVGNQDHSFMQGVEAVDNILNGSPEMTIESPKLVNGRKNSQQRLHQLRE